MKQYTLRNGMKLEHRFGQTRIFDKVLTFMN